MILRIALATGPGGLIGDGLARLDEARMNYRFGPWLSPIQTWLQVQCAAASLGPLANRRRSMSRVK